MGHPSGYVEQDINFTEFLTILFNSGRIGDIQNFRVDPTRQSFQRFGVYITSVDFGTFTMKKLRSCPADAFSRLLLVN